MKKVSVLLLLLWTASIGFGWNNHQTKITGKDFTIIGTNFNEFEDATFEIVVADTSVNECIIKASAIIKNGGFTCKGEIQYPQNAFLSIIKRDGSFLLKDIMILEPGVMRINYLSNVKTISKIEISGSKYNDIVRNKVFNDPECQAKENAYNEYLATLNEEEKNDKEIIKKIMEMKKVIFDTRFEKFEEISSTHPDPYARLLAMSYTRLKSDTETISKIKELEKELGSIPEIVVLLYNLEMSGSRVREFQKIGVGTTIKNFSAKDLKGNNFQLSDILKENDYVLLEFWASWCHPCRAEIPYMKKTYEKYKNKRFEIISFTLDKDIQKWEKASQEEDIPWINVGDLLAMKSPVVKMYGIGGVPMNYLVNKEGTIVAQNLRQEKLEEKLKELLINNQTAGEIIQKHIDKIGGKKSWDAVKSIKMTLVVSAGQGSMRFEHVNTKEGYQYAAMDMQGEKIVQMAYDGEIAWGINPETGYAEKKSGDILENTKRKAKEFPSPYIVYKDNGYKIEVEGTENIEGKECYKLKITKGKKTVNGKEIDNIYISFISKEDFLEIASEEKVYQGSEEIISRSIYSDFREVNGILIPFCTNINFSTGFVLSSKIEFCEINPEIDYSIFYNPNL
jgi:thiol-disulfide isomerase/thioredoxin